METIALKQSPDRASAALSNKDRSSRPPFANTQSTFAFAVTVRATTIRIAYIHRCCWCSWISKSFIRVQIALHVNPINTTTHERRGARRVSTRIFADVQSYSFRGQVAVYPFISLTDGAGAIHRNSRSCRRTAWSWVWAVGKAAFTRRPS